MKVNAFWLMLGALGVFAIFYRYYSAFLAAKAAALDDSRPTAAHRYRDGQNFVPTNRWILWGHHFAAISGAGPLIGPVLAAQFGFLPGFLWLVFGVCLAGATQDFLVLVASMRRGGRSLAEIAREEMGERAGLAVMLATIFIIVIALAVLGFVVVKALADSPWGTFTIAASIPIALVMGLWLHRLRPGRVAEASAIGVVLLTAAVAVGAQFQPGHALAPWASWFTLSEAGLTVAMALYGLVASVLPVWVLLCPRDYLSSYLKVGTVALIVGAVLVVRPVLRMPALTDFVFGGGPIIPGAFFPFVFVTIACGAISGMHALVSSGTTSKMIGLESEARAIGYGAMLMESVVGITALVAASSLCPGDYFQINLRPEAFAELARRTGLEQCHLSELAALVGEPRLAGRTGGGVSLAAGIAEIFGEVAWVRPAMAFVYHFVIMFEALFVLTAIDTGTRIGRFLLQEALGRLHPKLGQAGWMPGTILTSLLVVGGWSYFLFTGTIQTLWPMFGVSNQVLAVIALTVAATVLVNEGRGRVAWVAIGPLAFVTVTTLSGGFLSIRDIFLPMALHPRFPGEAIKGWLNASLTAGMMVLAITVLAGAAPGWGKHWRRGRKATIGRLNGLPAPGRQS